VTSVQDSAWLDQEQLDLAFGEWFMLDTLRDDEQLARAQADRTVAEIDAQLSLEHEKRFVGFRVIVPDELTLDAHELELVVVELRDDSRTPLLSNEAELLLQIDGLVCGCRAAPTVISDVRPLTLADYPPGYLMIRAITS